MDIYLMLKRFVLLWYLNLDTYRGQGLGVKMMECIEEYCENKWIESIALHVFGHP